MTNEEKLGLFKIDEAELYGDDEDFIYSLEAFEGEEFSNGNFILRVYQNNGWVEWVLLELVNCGEYRIYTQGSGASENLREPRHTYFGVGGYIFYVNPEMLSWCFKILSKWFDY